MKFSTQYNYNHLDHVSRPLDTKSIVVQHQSNTVREIIMKYAATGQVTIRPVEYGVTEDDFGNPILAELEEIELARYRNAERIKKANEELNKESVPDPNLSSNADSPTATGEVS